MSEQGLSHPSYIKAQRQHNDSDLFDFDQMTFTSCGKSGAYGPR